MGRLFIFAIGGTGARVLRSFTMMLAAGIDGLDSNTTIVPIIIDCDATNGDKTRTIEALKNYRQIHNSLYNDAQVYDHHFFMTKMASLGELCHDNTICPDFQINLGVPTNSGMTFADYINLGGIIANPNARIADPFIQALYDDSPENDKNAELNLPLEMGFKGNPNIGSIVFNKLNDTAEFNAFLHQYNPGHDKVLVIASIFGGTGASGLPKIINALPTNSVSSALVVMPYFDLGTPQDPDDTGAINHQIFKAKSAAALGYYQDTINNKANAIYYVADRKSDSIEYHEGKTKQKNTAHPAEFVAASAIVHFLKSGIDPIGHQAYEYCVTNDREGAEMRIYDFSNPSRTKFIDNLATFAIAMKFYRDRVIGDRGQVPSNTAFFSGFNLGTKINTGIHEAICNFLKNQDYGLYRWLDELSDSNKHHRHSIKMFEMVTAGNDDCKKIFPDVVIKNPLIGKSPIDDQSIISELNNFNSKTSDHSDKAFFKSLKDIAAKAYNAINIKGLLKGDGTDARYAFSHVNNTLPSDGWNPVAFFDGKALEKLDDGHADDEKIATSIPTMFARMYFAKTAFERIAKNRNGNTLQHRAVSDCLDMLELIFQNGGNSKLEIKQVNLSQMINNLNPISPKLADSITNELNASPALSTLTTMYLFFWKDMSTADGTEHSVLIGGTSPFTLVFLSPNFKSEIQKHGFEFKRLDGTMMFGNDLRSIDHRYSSFRDMLCHYYSTYLAFTGTGLAKYLNQFSSDLHAITPITPFLESYTQVDLNHDGTGALVSVNTLPIVYQKVKPANDYKIKPARNVAEDKPLVLNANGVPGLLYVGTAHWDSIRYQINDADRNKDLKDRTLPGYDGINYPYLTTFDFIEDKIIKLSYNIDASKFHTACTDTDGSRYLLPLKRKFFEYFNVEDIDNIVKVSKDGKNVKISLYIPINGGTITLSRIYSGNDILEGKSNDLVLGFFPFYKVSNRPDLDKYAILESKFSNSAVQGINFYSIDNINTPTRASESDRTNARETLPSTKYYFVPQSFDLIECNYGRSNALIVPKMESISINPAGHNYKVAVDLGTTNTYIAYAQAGTPPKTLTFGQEANQVVFLGTAMGEFDKMKDFYNREFAPQAIGNGSYANFPTKTATCEVDGWNPPTAKLFSDISVGFNINREQVTTNVNFKYHTDIKWSLERNPGDNVAIKRIEEYCLELLWIIKNQIIHERGGLPFTLCLSFPDSMTTQHSFIIAWQNAANKLGLNIGADIAIQSQSESVAPYYSFPNFIGGNNFVNIDIGGGTTDILIVNWAPVAAGLAVANAYRNSIRFAANDLWGDGVQIAALAPKDNGFMNFIKAPIENNNLDYVCNIMPDSADIMSYLFSLPHLHAASKIQANEKLRTLLTVHYAAIIMHVSRLINKANIQIPGKMTFTGMGSKYIDIISGNDDARLQTFTKFLLESFTGQNAIFYNLAKNNIIEGGAQVNSKEVAAKGILMKDLYAGPYQIGTTNEIVDLGIDTNINGITYGGINDAITDEVLASYKKFLDSLTTTEFTNKVYNLFGFIFDTSVIDLLKQVNIMLDFNMVKNSYNPRTPIKENLVLFIFKHAIYEVSKQIFLKSKKNNN